MSLTSYQTAPPRDSDRNINLPPIRKAATRVLNFWRGGGPCIRRKVKTILRRGRLLPFCIGVFRGRSGEVLAKCERRRHKSQVLGSGEHDEIADRHVSRAGQHENDGFCHVL